MQKQSTLLKIINLTKEYQTGGTFFRGTKSRFAVTNISIDIFTGECLALIGETGSGKSTLGKCLLRLANADAGSAFYNDIDLFQLSEKEFRHYRPKFQMIFQNPLQTLNPRQSIGACLTEPLKVHKSYNKKESSNRVRELLFSVGLEADMVSRFPHELSGGQRQRIAIARALATEPIFLVADEPTSSLDASVKHQIIELLQDLQFRFHLTLLLISHDLTMVYEISNRIAVMYDGVIVEIAPSMTLMRSPVHPYSKLLVQSASDNLNVETRSIDWYSAKEELFFQSRPGCEFSNRCPWAESICFAEKPVLKPISDEHSVACHLIETVYVEI